MQRLLNQVAVVTGASTGIGRSIVESYADEGATVVLAARNRQALDEVAATIRPSTDKLLVVPTDVRSEHDVSGLFRITVAHFGRVDILINSAGVSATTPTDSLSLAAWQEVIDVNLTGAFLCSREAFRIMKTQGVGRIVNIGSVSAKVPRRNSAAYTASKFGLDGLTRSLALDAREYGIAISIVHPGNTLTSLWEGREARAHQEGVMSPKEIARLVVAITTLPPNVNVLETVVLPVSMPFLGRG